MPDNASMRTGSSPYTRRTASSFLALNISGRFISVHTENRNLPICPRSLVTVHLRTHGEQRKRAVLLALQGGSSPYTRRTDCKAAGISESQAVHLRTHGEQTPAFVSLVFAAGSSPYTRRTDCALRLPLTKLRFISVHTENRRRSDGFREVIRGSSPYTRRTDK